MRIIKDHKTPKADPRCVPVLRSELIQLVTVTQKKAEMSYRELIEQQIHMYKSR